MLLMHTVKENAEIVQIFNPHKEQVKLHIHMDTTAEGISYSEF